MGNGFGSESSVRVKMEATPGTAPTTGFHLIPFTKVTMIPKLGNRIVSKVIGANRFVPAAFRSPIKMEGSLATEGGFNSLDWLWYLMLGTKATTGGGADPYTNTYSPGATPPTAHIEYIAGDIPTGKCYRYQNVVCSDLKVAIDFNGLIDIQATLPAEKEDSASGGDTPTSAGLVTVSHVPINPGPQATVWNVGVGSDTTYCVTKVAFNLRRPLAPDIACAGSTFYRAPSFASPLEGDYEFDVLWQDEAAYRAFVAGTVLTSIKFKIVGGALLTGNYTLEIRANKSDLDEAGPPETIDNGHLFQKLKGTLYGTGGSAMTSEGLAIQTINAIDGAVL